MFHQIADLQADSVFAAATFIFMAAIPITLIARGFDSRQLSGDHIWSKPFKFALSLAVHFATFAVITGLMKPPARDGTGLLIAAWVSAAAGLFELAYISIQAVRGRHSHFNSATGLERMMSMLMGLGAIIVLVPALVIGVVVITGPIAEWPWSVRSGVAIGMMGGAGLTLLTGFAMGAAGSHFAVAPASPSLRMRFTGWSLDGADLRPSHFLATHMMQGVPIAAALAALLLPDPAGLMAASIFAGLWAILTYLTYRSALAGRALPSWLRVLAQR